MLDYKVLSNKPILHNSALQNNDEDYMDLLAKTFSNDSNITGTIVIVNEYYVARPDLISLAMYGDDSYADVICKLNGISNPFELNEDDMLFIPSIECIPNCIKSSPVASSLVSENNKLVKNVINDKRKKPTEKRSSNELVIGNSNYVIDKSLGLVFY